MIWFVLGLVLGAATPRAWVRGGAAWAQGAIGTVWTWSVGAKPSAAFTRPTRETVPRETLRETVRPNGAKIPIATTLKNWGAFLAGCAGFVIRHPLLVLSIVVLSLWLMPVRLPFDFAKSRGELRLEREIAQREAQFQETLRERDEAINAIRTDTARTLQQIRLESQRGHDAIAAATPEHEEPIDPNLVAAWRDALDGLCVARADGTRSNSC